MKTNLNRSAKVRSRRGSQSCRGLNAIVQILSLAGALRHRRDDHQGLGDGALIGDGDVDAGLAAGRRDLLQPAQRAAGQPHGGPARRKVNDAHVAPEYAAAEAGAQRLGAGLLGGEALGIGFHPVGPPLGARPFGLGEDAGEEALAVALDRALDAPNIDQVRTDAMDHGQLYASKSNGDDTIPAPSYSLTRATAGAI